MVFLAFRRCARVLDGPGKRQEFRAPALAPNLHYDSTSAKAGHRRKRIMKLHTNEMLLALRSPSSGWLAAMVCALEEAVRDPEFTDHHRELVRQMLDVNAIPAPIAAAAQERLSRFEEEITNTQVELYDSLSNSVAAQPSRPKLTLVSSVAA
jgi:hypothetical protein